MAAKTFEQVLDEVRGKPILVANRGIPARRICRAIRERFAAVPVMTATDIDKAAPAASSAQELLLLGSDPRAYLDLDLIIAKAKQRGIIAIQAGASRRKTSGSPRNAKRRASPSSAPKPTP